MPARSENGSAFSRQRGRAPAAVIDGYIDTYRDRFRFEPICRVLSGTNLAITPDAYYAHRPCPVSDAEWTEAHLADQLFDLWRPTGGSIGDQTAGPL